MLDGQYWAPLLSAAGTAAVALYATRDKWRQRAEQREDAYMVRQDANEAKLRARIVELEAEVSIWRTLAYAWFNAGHRVFHAFAQLLMIANGRLERAGAMPVPCEIPNLPNDVEKPP